MSRRDTSEDREAKLGCFHDVVADRNIRPRVSFHIGLMHEGDPAVTPSDVRAAQNYLKACVLNMSLAELNMTTLDDFAALWARGAIGAAMYRARKALKSTKRMNAGEE